MNSLTAIYSKTFMLQKRLQALLKTDFIIDSIAAIIVHAWSFTESRLRHSLILKTDSASEFTTNLVITIFRPKTLLKTDSPGVLNQKNDHFRTRLKLGYCHLQQGQTSIQLLFGFAWKSGVLQSIVRPGYRLKKKCSKVITKSLV